VSAGQPVMHRYDSVSAACVQYVLRLRTQL